MVQVRQGKAVQLIFTITTGLPPTLFDPPSLPLVFIQDPNSTVQVNGLAATKISVGKYSYPYTVPIAGVLGTWVVWMDATDASGNPSGSLKTNAFQVVAA